MIQSEMWRTKCSFYFPQLLHHLKSVNYSFLQQSKPNSGREFSLGCFFTLYPTVFRCDFQQAWCHRWKCSSRKMRVRLPPANISTKSKRLTSLFPKNCGNTGLWAEEIPVVNNPSKKLLGRPKLVLCQVLVRSKKLTQKEFLPSTRFEM